MKKEEITTFQDGAVVRWHNKKISFKETDNGLLINFRFADVKNPNGPACSHRCLRGKVRETQIKLSEEAMELLISAYIAYRKGLLDDEL